MAQQFSPAERQAVWVAYDRRCFYCTAPISWSALNLDHVVPQGLDAAAIDEQLTRLRLPSDFDIRSELNIVPAHAACNLRKRDLVPNTNQMIYLLAQVEARAPRVRELRDKYERERRGDALRAQLEVALSMGALSRQDVDAVIDSSAPRHVRARIARSAGLLYDDVLDDLKPRDGEALFDVALAAFQAADDGLSLVNSTNERRHIRTVREYVEASSQGFYASTTLDMKFESQFKNALGMLLALAAAKPSEISHLDQPRVGLCDPQLLPSSLLPYIGDAPERREERDARLPTIARLVAARKVTISDVTSHGIDIIDGIIKTSFREILRADLDDDGLEDLLVSVFVRATGGSMAFGLVPVALARRGGDQLFERTAVVPVPAAGDGDLHKKR